MGRTLAQSAVQLAPLALLAPVDEPGRARAAALARALQVPLTETPDGCALLLAFADDRLELREPHSRARLCVDSTLAERRRYLATAADPLRRAIGAAPKRVVDATAGLGQDALRLAWLGHNVLALERHPVVAALFEDGLRRARANGVLDGVALELLRGEAHTLLATLAPPPEVVYLDFMFPEKRRRSAAVRKEMRLVRLLAGADEDALGVFQVARAHATDRVVVKRPDDAAPLAPSPNASYGGKLVRYDVYRVRR